MRSATSVPVIVRQKPHCWILPHRLPPGESGGLSSLLGGSQTTATGNKGKHASTPQQCPSMGHSSGWGQRCAISRWVQEPAPPFPDSVPPRGKLPERGTGISFRLRSPHRVRTRSRTGKSGLQGVPTSSGGSLSVTLSVTQQMASGSGPSRGPGCRRPHAHSCALEEAGGADFHCSSEETFLPSVFGQWEGDSVCGRTRAARMGTHKNTRPGVRAGPSLWL